MHENLAWLTQKTEESKRNTGNFTFPTHTVNIIELQSNKKVATSPFLPQPRPSPSFQDYPLFLAKSLELTPSPLPPPPPQVTKFFEGPTP